MAIESQQQAFEQFEKNSVRVSESQNKAAKEVHPEIRGVVEEALEQVTKTFLQAPTAARFR